MKLSYSWLKDYLPHEISLDETSKILTKIGLEVEGTEKAEAIPGSLEGLVIGFVTSCEAHPNSDHLHITKVDIGQAELLPIVCGAPNVAQGQKVVVAPVGTTVYPNDGAPFLIKKAKIRGEASEGMICAEDEIGLGNSHAGIMILPEDAPIGTLANQYFNIAPADHTIEIGLTPNRSDGNSHIGAARDICAYQKHHRAAEANQWNIVFPKVNLTFPTSDIKPINISIETKACSRYSGIVIDHVNVGESPEWLQQRLRAIGIRPINNVVDITNYVLNEYGQPLHAFDYDKIANHHIIAKHLPENTPFITLDGVERKLRNEDLMICDDQNGLCLAGVFGGKESGINSQTTTVFIESAYFDPRTIRRTSMHYGLRTDAAQHFEKGVDIEMIIPALERATSLMVEICGGTIASTLKDNYPIPFEPRVIDGTYDEINNLCGKIYSNTQIINILDALGFEIIEQAEHSFKVKVPSNKVDVYQVADLVEEVLRIDGLDNVIIPSRLNISLLTREEPAHLKWEEKLATQLTGLGFSEIVTNSITNEKYYPENQNLVKMLNSLTTELNVMRPSMLESGLEVIAYNINRRQQDLKLYEIANTYYSEGVGKYFQQKKLAIYLTGLSKVQSWQSPSNEITYYDAKGIVEKLLTICGIKKVQEQSLSDGFVWNRGKAQLAVLTKVSQEKLQLFGIKQDVYFIDINIKEWVDAAASAKIKFSELPKFPAVYRDLALVLDNQISYEKVKTVTQNVKLNSLIDFNLFDKFESEKLGSNKKSLALNYVFQLNDRTLTDDEVESMMSQLTNAYQKELNAIIRS